MTSYRRTRSAILEGTKSLIASVGLHHTNMIDIADTSQVSRATLYNHFRDKGSVVRALLESEVDRIFQLVDSDISPADALLSMSRAISSDPALAMMRKTDPAKLTRILIENDDALWQQINEGLTRLLGDRNRSEIARLWLIGQVMQPVAVDQGRAQSRAIASTIL
jgi:TetR/AcrR family transcriptional regulator, transcriptional repressor of aconitase